jgi:hypothetical protein
MASFIRLLLLLGIIGGAPWVISSGVETVTPINSVTFSFPIQLALYDPSDVCYDSILLPMLLPALHSLFCMKRLDMILLDEAYANICPANKERAWLWQSLILHSPGRENGGVQAESSSNGNFTWVIWSIDFFILKIPESFIEEALQGANHTNQTVAAMTVAQRYGTKCRKRSTHRARMVTWMVCFVKMQLKATAACIAVPWMFPTWYWNDGRRRGRRGCAPPICAPCFSPWSCSGLLADFPFGNGPFVKQNGSPVASYS